MGVNREFHYRLASEKTWHEVGHHLVPKDEWNDVLENPGPRSVIVEGKRPNSQAGIVKVKVEPSNEIEFGIFIEINDHYELSPNPGASSDIDNLRDILTEYWNESMQHARRISKKIACLGDDL